MQQKDVPPTFANDRIVPMAEVGGDPDSETVLHNYADKVGKEYLTAPPMAELGARNTG